MLSANCSLSHSYSGSWFKCDSFSWSGHKVLLVSAWRLYYYYCCCFYYNSVCLFTLTSSALIRDSAFHTVPFRQDMKVKEEEEEGDDGAMRELLLWNQDRCCSVNNVWQLSLVPELRQWKISKVGFTSQCNWQSNFYCGKCYVVCHRAVTHHDLWSLVLWLAGVRHLAFS